MSFHINRFRLLLSRSTQKSTAIIEITTSSLQTVIVLQHRQRTASSRLAAPPDPSSCSAIHVLHSLQHIQSSLSRLWRINPRLAISTDSNQSSGRSAVLAQNSTYPPTNVLAPYIHPQGLRFNNPLLADISISCCGTMCCKE
jgi:hypothetical protein